MYSVDPRELRQHALALVKRAEAGEPIEVRVSGRPVAMLVPVEARRWRSWADVAAVFDGPADSAWESDRMLVDQQVRDRSPVP